MRFEIAMPSEVCLSVPEKKIGLMLVGVPSAKPCSWSDELVCVLVAVLLCKSFISDRFSLPCISHQ